MNKNIKCDNMPYEWTFGKDFNKFLEDFEKYIREYYTKNMILTNYMIFREDEKLLEFGLSTPSIDIMIELDKQNKVIKDFYFTDAWMGGNNRILEEWNGLKLTEEQYNKLINLCREIYSHYKENEEKYIEMKRELTLKVFELILKQKKEEWKNE